MIVIQTLLITGVIAVFGWFLIHPKSYRVRAWIKILTALFTVLAVVFIILPNTATRIAQFVGVGRGADLLLYVLTIAFIYVILNLYNESKEDEKTLVILSRNIALLEAKLNRLSEAPSEISEDRPSPKE